MPLFRRHAELWNSIEISPPVEIRTASSYFLFPRPRVHDSYRGSGSCPQDQYPQELYRLIIADAEQNHTEETVARKV